MFYPQIQDNENQRETITQWLGLNQNYYCADGEFSDMENLSSDNYPLLSPRQPRPVLRVMPSGIRGMVYTNSCVVYLYGTKLHYSDTEEDLDMSEQFGDDTESDQTLLRYGAYILIFPLGYYVNIFDIPDRGFMADSYTSPDGMTVTLEPCDMYGRVLSEKYTYTVSTTRPENSKENDYWYNPNERVLSCYDEDTGVWIVVQTVYIKVSVTDDSGTAAGLSKHFREGDAVDLNLPVDDVNQHSVIQRMADNYFVIIGLLPEGKTITMDKALKIERKLPPLDMVCVSGNRVWGCYFGKGDDGNVLNEIHASKLGDPKNWYCYNSVSTDSYAVNVGRDGDWTGCIEYNGRPTFFKEDTIYMIYGRYPSEYQVITIDGRGVQKGSERSLACVDGHLIYKSVTDVCVFDGSNPVSISAALGRNVYYHGVGGGCLGKYYIRLDSEKYHKTAACYKSGNAFYVDEAHAMKITPKSGMYYKDIPTWNVYIYKGKDGNGDDVFEETESEFYEPNLFVYDLNYGLWYKESSMAIEYFCASSSGRMYAYSNDRLYGFGAQPKYDTITDDKYYEPAVKWYGETGPQGYAYPDYKYLCRLTIRAYVEREASIRVLISYDDGPWQEVGVQRNRSNTRTETWTILPVRCDHFKLRFEGQGDVKIVSLSRTLDTGSEET